MLLMRSFNRCHKKSRGCQNVQQCGYIGMYLERKKGLNNYDHYHHYQRHHYYYHYISSSFTSDLKKTKSFLFLIGGGGVGLCFSLWGLIR